MYVRYQRYAKETDTLASVSQAGARLYSTRGLQAKINDNNNGLLDIGSISRYDGPAVRAMTCASVLGEFARMLDWSATRCKFKIVNARGVVYYVSILQV